MTPLEDKVMEVGQLIVALKLQNTSIRLVSGLAVAAVTYVKLSILAAQGNEAAAKAGGAEFQRMCDYVKEIEGKPRKGKRRVR